MRRFVPAPPSFRGTWDEFYSKCVEPNLPAVEVVRTCHEWLHQYCLSAAPVFVIRAPRGLERGSVYYGADGTAFRASDNSPAWCFHYLLFNELIHNYAVFEDAVASLPCHMFDVKRFAPQSISDAGYYVAHIYPVKDRAVPCARWTRAEIVRRFYRNIHPCNIFFVPKCSGRQLGENGDIIRFFAAQFCARYGETWHQFRAMVGGTELDMDLSFGASACEFGFARSSGTSDVGDIPSAGLASYTATRLTFKAAVIEPLAETDSFEIVTPGGTFRMTKRDFEREFSNVIRSESYRVGGLYSYRVVPQRALRFLAGPDA